MDPHFELEGDVGPAKPAASGLRWPVAIRDLIRWALALACLLVLISLLMPWSTFCDWEAARRAQCTDNLKQIGLALLAYQERYGAFPPAYVADESGQPVHSWRVLILPFLDQQALYERYDLHEPWDGPNNRKLLGEMPKAFLCPSRKPQPTTTTTSYVALTGPGTVFPGPRCVPLREVTDGADRTLIVVETSNRVVPWTSPGDLNVRSMSDRINDPRNRGISSPHEGGANVAWANAHVTFVKDALPAKWLRSFTTIAGQDANPDDDGSQSD